VGLAREKIKVPCLRRNMKETTLRRPEVDGQFDRVMLPRKIERAMGPVANPGAQQHQVVTGTDKRKLPEPR
jgi:hypothetical protein